DRGLDARARRGLDVLLAVDHTRDGHRRDAGAFRNVVNRRGPVTAATGLVLHATRSLLASGCGCLRLPRIPDSRRANSAPKEPTRERTIAGMSPPPPFGMELEVAAHSEHHLATGLVARESRVRELEVAALLLVRQVDDVERDLRQRRALAVHHRGQVE